MCGIKTTDSVSLYCLILGLKEICRKLSFLCVYRQVSEQVWACVVFYDFTVSFVLSEGIMVDLRRVSREFLTKFIHMYSEYRFLWRVKRKEYSDRVTKNLAYEHLTTKLKEIGPDAKLL